MVLVGGFCAFNPTAHACDLSFRADPLGWIEIPPNAGVVAQQGRGAVAELLGDVGGRLALVDQQRREARSQVTRTHSRRPIVLAGGQPGGARRRAKRPDSPVVPIVAGPVIAARVRDDRGVVGRTATCLAPGAESSARGASRRVARSCGTPRLVALIRIVRRRIAAQVSASASDSGRRPAYASRLIRVAERRSSRRRHARRIASTCSTVIRIGSRSRRCDGLSTCLTGLPERL